MATCFNCGVSGELRREANAPGNEIGGGCPLCRECWEDMIGERTPWEKGIAGVGDDDSDGCYVSWDAGGRPVVTAQSFGRDSRWFSSRALAEQAIDEWRNR